MPSSQQHEHTRTRPSSVLLAGSFVCTAVAVVSFAMATQKLDHGAQQSTSETVAMSEDGRKIAPVPLESFRDQQCDKAPGSQKSSGARPSSLEIPSQHISTTITPSADLTLPAAPDGIFYDRSQPLGSGNGNSVTAGHVDYGPGALSTRGGELSPWGHLHAVSACDDVFATDPQGRTHHYRVTDKFTVPQKELDASGIFSTTGDARLVMVTCSGESVEDAGGPLQFHYDHNLVVMAQEVTA